MTQELIERLRKMQREAWATDAEIASADALERLTANNKELIDNGDRLLAVADSLRDEKTRLTAERDAYQVAADKMAMEHKVERDALSVQIDALAKDAARRQGNMLLPANAKVSGGGLPPSA
jgi:hypothetical protein